METDSHKPAVVYTGTRAPSAAPDHISVVHRPLLEVSPLRINLERLELWTDDATGIVLYSRNAIRALRENGAYRKLAPFDRHVWWAVGEKTAGFLHREFGVRARYPTDQCFEGLKLELAEADLPNRVVAFSLEGTERDLEPVLAERGIDFVDLPVYRTVPVDYASPSDVVGGADWLVFTSSKGVRALFACGAENADSIVSALEHTRVATIGPKTASTARELGLAVDLVPDEPDRDRLLARIGEDREPRT